MIYPEYKGRGDGKELHLRALERVFIQGKLKMWGRWSGMAKFGSAGNMFNMLLASNAVTKTAITKALQELKKAGVEEGELHSYLLDLLEGKQKSSLAFCTDQEAATIDGVIGTTLLAHPGLFNVIRERYMGKGKSKKAMAADLHERSDWCMRTCETRIDVWLKTAEFMMYLPMSDAFNFDAGRYKS
ncbi:Protein of uncharacterised function (DUF1133) [Serratia fonticola]|uniref:DUF1133 family protein n=1 Tax=Serratia fonticola TaxID=47917 RepID=A0AAE7SSD8_SERFO|nr:DUF1133 family protein [Serratia fonticola]MBC3230734.1 DUF1133 family protein [Serratia fonticola]QXT42358.1 DUF1133 family protein [Serratia fonticola]CAI1591641.1 Protein of uncharacterised function (DUF1133) [Serratia fonticola]CAI1602689.1 Protein of uncharacterised function (DUF1133) [Serratia fonticola]CAI1907017.1 Protein of uncharacterised function (DUF1133) [Serratia fonticola]